MASGTSVFEVAASVGYSSITGGPYEGTDSGETYSLAVAVSSGSLASS